MCLMTFIVVFTIMIIISFFGACLNNNNWKHYFCLASYTFLVIHCRYIQWVRVRPFFTIFSWALTYPCTQWKFVHMYSVWRDDVASSVRYLCRRSRLDIWIIFYFVNQYARNVVKMFPLQRAKSVWNSALVQCSRQRISSSQPQKHE